MNLTTERLAYLLCLGAVIAFFAVRSCNDRRDAEIALREAALYKDTAIHYKGLNGADVAENKALALRTQGQLQALLSKYDTLARELKKFKQVAAAVINNNSTTIVGDTSRFKMPIPCAFEPFHVKRDTLFYHFRGTVGRTFFSIDTLTIPDRESVVVGRKRQGFLRAPDWKVDVIHSNPLVRTSGTQAFAVDARPAWYETRAFNIGVGLVLGVAIDRRLLK